MTLLPEHDVGIVKAFPLFGNSRLTISVGGPGSTFPEIVDDNFAITVNASQGSDGTPIFVERAMYGDAGSQPFGIGTNATATPIR